MTKIHRSIKITDDQKLIGKIMSINFIYRIFDLAVYSSVIMNEKIR